MASSSLSFPPEHSERPDDYQTLGFFRPLSLRLQRVNGSQEKADQWWRVEECVPGPDLSARDCKGIEMVVINEKVSPSSLGFLAGHGWVAGGHRGNTVPLVHNTHWFLIW